MHSNVISILDTSKYVRICLKKKVASRVMKVCEHRTNRQSWPMIWRLQCGPGVLDCWCEGVYSLLPIKRLLCSACVRVRVCMCVCRIRVSLWVSHPPLIFSISLRFCSLGGQTRRTVHGFYVTTTPTFKTRVWAVLGQGALPLGALRCMVSMGPMNA